MARMPPSRRTGKFAPVMPPKMGVKTAKHHSPAVNESDSCTSSSSSSSNTVGNPENGGSGHEDIGSSEQMEREKIEQMTAQKQGNDLPSGSIATGFKRIPTTSAAAGPPNLDHIHDGMSSPDDIRCFGKKKAERIATGKLAIEDGREYDMQLWKAVFKTIQSPWLFASCLETIYGKSAFYSTLCHINVLVAILRSTSPLVTREIINQLSLAGAYRAATTPNDLQPPRSIGYGIGLAIALTAMQFFGSMFSYHGQQIESMTGCKMRAAVRLLTRNDC